jgi:hypothetical protein
VTFALAGTSPIGAGFGNIDGTYTAPRCFVSVHDPDGRHMLRELRN